MQNSDAIRSTLLSAYLKPPSHRNVKSHAESGAGGGKENQCFSHCGRRKGMCGLLAGGAFALVGDFGCHCVLLLLMMGQVGDL